jgi:HEAT repeat protein
MTEEYTIDMVQVIGDFLELGHVENIVAMFKQDTSLYGLAGDLLRDERYAVRLGLAVLFEELARVRPEEVSLAIPVLLPLLDEKDPRLRGEAATILGIIGSKSALVHLLKLENDRDPQVREIIADIIHNPGTSTPSGNEEHS